MALRDQKTQIVLNLLDDVVDISSHGGCQGLRIMSSKQMKKGDLWASLWWQMQAWVGMVDDPGLRDERVPDSTEASEATATACTAST